jgi:hypothetical protein
MAEKKKNQIITYASPINAANVKNMADRMGTSQSKIVNKALTEYFSKPSDNKKPS